ncbi:serine/threonine-protein kinase [Sorangium sp. So ce1389]|uniref:serine/threonine-protein kinase n=1 Tax=Sorangium sp. So ce1389 TaxID=3133336 RepID=UPI003F60E67F
MSFLEGSLVAGRFLIEALARKGGMGEVFRARDVTTGAPVALKLLHAEAERPEEAERFLREARLLSSLKHPGIVEYLAHGKAQDGRPFIAMEWLSGRELGERLDRGPLRLSECVVLLRKVADALAVAHARGVVHRDIKPSNLFLRDERVDGVAVLDFGIARLAAAGMTLTRTGRFVGTPGYMAPEQARGDRDLGPSADIFALGCVLFECLTGKHLFGGRDLVGVLAKILFDDVPAVSSLRPDTPPALAELLARMLDKDPQRRPPDAAALRDQLAALTLPEGDDEAPVPALAAPPSPRVLTGEAMQLLSVVLAMWSASDPSETLPPSTVQTWARPTRDALRFRLARLGGRAEWLADGSLIVVVSPSSSALDQVSAAARCALEVQQHWPGARIALTTGRGLLQGGVPAGEAIDRAVALLRVGAEPTVTADAEPSYAAVEPGIWLDELSSRLLESRFLVTTLAGQLVLRGERASVDESRPLLGRPTPCVGREQELSMLLGAIEGCIEEAMPSGALVIAAPGMGKSRLRHELLRRLGARSPEVEVLFGSGAAMSAGSPYGLLGEALRRLCEVEAGDPPAAQEAKIHLRVGRHVPPADAERVSEFIATLCGVAVERPSVSLRAARGDPKIMSEQIRRAFLDLIRAEAAARPCLLVLEDLHWGDAATVKLVDAALLDLRERAFFVLAFARREVHDVFPKLWEGRVVQRVPLAGLTRKAAERLVTAVLGAEVPASLVARIVEQAAGNALFLEELIRAVVEGKSEGRPATVLAMLQARLSCLEPQARKVLCSASVFGQTFWRGGVLALLGQAREATGGDGADRWLESLVRSEMVEVQWSSRFPGDAEYRFRHVLVRDAAYGLLAAQDRILGHRLAGAHLEQAGEADPMVLAEHAHLGGELERAALYYLRAAEQSYRSNDYDGMLSRVERGMSCDPRGDTLGRLLGMKLDVCFLREDWQVGLEIGREALSVLARGSVAWNRAVGRLVVMAGHLGLADELESLVNAIMGSEPEPGAEAACCMPVATAITALSHWGRRDLSLRLLARLEQLAARVPEGEQLAHAQLRYSRSMFLRLLGDDPWRAYEDARRAEEVFAEVSPWRWREFAASSTALSMAELGEHAEAERKLRESLERTLRINDAFTLSSVRVWLMILLTECCAPEHLEEITALADQLIKIGAMEATMGPAHGALARVLMVRGRLPEAREAAERALAILQRDRFYRPLVYRTLIEVLLREGRVEAAREASDEGLRCLESLGGSVGYSEIPLRIAISEAHLAGGDVALARAAIERALCAVEVRAGKIPDAAVRRRYVEQVPANARVRELSRAWLGRDVDRSPGGEPPAA